MLVGNDSLLNHTGCTSQGTTHQFHQSDTSVVSASCEGTDVTHQVSSSLSSSSRGSKLSLGCNGDTVGVHVLPATQAFTSAKSKTRSPSLSGSTWFGILSSSRSSSAPIVGWTVIPNHSGPFGNLFSNTQK